VTVAGTTAAEELELSVTEALPEGAAMVNVTVACELVPPITETGDKTIEFMAAAGLTVRLAVLLTLPMVAVMVADEMDETAEVVAVKVAVVLPPATVMALGTEAAEELLLSDTEIPPEGAAPVNVTVPWELTPPVTEVGEMLTAESAGGVTVRDAV
jgi:hypothetical protein